MLTGDPMKEVRAMSQSPCPLRRNSNRPLRVAANRRFDMYTSPDPSPPKGPASHRPRCHRHAEIGRETGRERVCKYVSISVAAVLLKQKDGIQPETLPILH